MYLVSQRRNRKHSVIMFFQTIESIHQVLNTKHAQAGLRFRYGIRFNVGTTFISFWLQLQLMQSKNLRCNEIKYLRAKQRSKQSAIFQNEHQFASQRTSMRNHPHRQRQHLDFRQFLQHTKCTTCEFATPRKPWRARAMHANSSTHHIPFAFKQHTSHTLIASSSDGRAPSYPLHKTAHCLFSCMLTDLVALSTSIAWLALSWCIVLVGEALT